nr:immunoglobulin light chain junction region [Macaca mulatta]
CQQYKDLLPLTF